MVIRASMHLINIYEIHVQGTVPDFILQGSYLLPQIWGQTSQVYVPYYVAGHV